MSDDIKSLLEKLTLIEGSVTPSSYPKRGLNKQQKSVKQMPALFKMPKQGPVLGGDPNKKAPSQGYFVGGEAKESEAALEEAYASEDVLSTVKKGLADFLRSIEDKQELDKALVNKAKDEIRRDDLDRLLPVKTVQTHDGRDIKIHGNEVDGFHVRINERPVTAKFRMLDDAIMACEMYCNRRRMAEEQTQAEDYVSEE
jgi:hypothetical protein